MDAGFKKSEEICVSLGEKKGVPAGAVSESGVGGMSPPLQVWERRTETGAHKRPVS